MPTAYRNAQLQGTAGVTTYANLYTTGAAATAVVSSLAICNTASTNATYRVAIVPASGSATAPSASNWLVFDTTVGANDTSFLTVGLTMSQSQYIRVSSSANSVTFTAFVSEIT